MLVWFLPLFMVLILIGLPIFFALLAAPGALLILTGQARDIAVLYRNVYVGMDSFPLMALPFFMLAGEIMNRGGITTRLVEFSQAIMGHLRGGLAHVNILSSILFAGMSGSAVADVSALGGTLIPAMEKNGYTRRFAAAITAASAVIGPIIPPSGIMIIYAYVMGESVAALFLAGIVPGLLVGVGLMVDGPADGRPLRPAQGRADRPSRPDRLAARILGQLGCCCGSTSRRSSTGCGCSSSGSLGYDEPPLAGAVVFLIMLPVAHGLLLDAQAARQRRLPGHLQEGRGAAADADHHPRRHPDRRRDPDRGVGRCRRLRADRLVPGPALDDLVAT